MTNIRTRLMKTLSPPLDTSEKRNCLALLGRLSIEGSIEIYELERMEHYGNSYMPYMAVKLQALGAVEIDGDTVHLSHAYVEELATYWRSIHGA